MLIEVRKLIIRDGIVDERENCADKIINIFKSIYIKNEIGKHSLMENILKIREKSAEKIQEAYNKEHGIIPKTIQKSIRELISATKVEEIQTQYHIGKEETIEEVIAKLTDEMLRYAANMEFEKAAEVRDNIKELEKMV